MVQPRPPSGPKWSGIRAPASNQAVSQCCDRRAPGVASWGRVRGAENRLRETAPGRPEAPGVCGPSHPGLRASAPRLPDRKPAPPRGPFPAPIPGLGPIGPSCPSGSDIAGTGGGRRVRRAGGCEPTRATDDGLRRVEVRRRPGVWRTGWLCCHQRSFDCRQCADQAQALGLVAQAF